MMFTDCWIAGFTKFELGERRIYPREVLSDEDDGENEG